MPSLAGWPSIGCNGSFSGSKLGTPKKPDSLLSGALSISETYIYTVESFKDYWDHLQPDGLIYILHWSGERLFATALQALKEMGVERPEDKFFIIQYERGFNHFYLKKGDKIKATAKCNQGGYSHGISRSKVAIAKKT